LALDISHLDQEAITTSEIELHQFCQDGGLIFTGRELSINHPGFDLAVLTFELHDCCHGQGIDHRTYQMQSALQGSIDCQVNLT